MSADEVRQAHATLCARVMAVAAVHRRCLLLAGGGRLVWVIGLPLLAVCAAHAAVALPYYLRLPVLPLAVVGLAWLTWRKLVMPLRARFTPQRAALLVEAARPQLNSRVVSAIEVFADLDRPRPHFDRGLVEALVIHAQRSTQDEDFRTVVDRRPARRQALLAVATVLMWVTALIAAPGVGRALGGMASAWGEARELAYRVSGAGIEIEPPGKAYLVGSTITVRARAHGFKPEAMQATLRKQGAAQTEPALAVMVDDDGRAALVLPDARETFTITFAAGTIVSSPVTVVVSEAPRIAGISIEYQLPDYVRRAPIVQPRSDGNLTVLYGSTVTITLETNKDLATAELIGSFAEQPVRFQVAGRFAKAVLLIDVPRWLADPTAEIAESYRLKLTDGDGFSNQDADQSYALVVTKDLAPTVAFVGLPQRTSADEIHLVEGSLGAIGVAIRANDDYGISTVTLRCRIESLENGATKREKVKEQQFPLPRADLPHLPLLRLSDLNAEVGDRIVITAEVSDAYDLQPELGPHRTRTASFRFAVVTQEELFKEAAYKDDWSTQWYEPLQIASMAKREIPARQSPEREAAAKVAAKLLDAAQGGDAIRGADQQLVQDYFDSLSIIQADEKTERR